MTSKVDSGRRRFMRVIAGGVSVAPIVLLGVSGPALADELPHLGADDPTGMALGYVEDTTAADSARFPQHSAEQKCSNCQLVQGEFAAPQQVDPRRQRRRAVAPQLDDEELPPVAGGRVGDRRGVAEVGENRRHVPITTRRRDD